MAALSRRLRRGARLLEAGTPATGAIRTLLASLDYAGDADAGVRRPDRAALLRAAAGMTRLFQLQSISAPGLRVFGAEIDPAAQKGATWDGPTASVSGTGTSTSQAFEACIGEAVELLSQYALHSDEPHWLRADPASVGATDALRAVLAPLAPDCDWLPATRLTDGAPTFVPVDLCLRRPESRRDFVAPYPLSIGCAAGPTASAATLHALLELIERDAAALWWRGGVRGHALSVEAMGDAAALLGTLRHGHAARRTWLLDITGDLPVPCVAAVSCRADGVWFAAGLAARTTMQAAACAAILELCQMELGGQVAAAKQREAGDTALNPRDHAHLRRQAGFSVAACQALHPLPPRASAATIDAADPGDAVSALVDRLAAQGLVPVAVDLTRPFLAIPVIRVICPGLEQEPSLHIGSRLAAQIARTGGAGAYTNGVSLM